MTSMMKRVLTTAVTLPALFFVIFFLPQYNYLTLSILAMLTAIAAASEMHGLFAKANAKLRILTIPCIGLIPVAQWLSLTFFPTIALVELVVIALVLLFYSAEIFDGIADDFEHSLLRIGAKSAMIIYPGLLITYIQRLTTLAHPTATLLLFFLFVFGNDVFAFLFGMWLGKNNRGVVAVSPNKSVAGFIGGTLMAMLLGFLFATFVPNLTDFFTPLQATVLGFATAIAASIGDLIESAFKRSVKVKDSGFLIPGRGGLLDSIDSMLLGAPVFFLIASML